MLICPFAVTLPIFLSAFPAVLRHQNDVEDITVVSACRVPVVKFKTRDVSVDVVFVSLASHQPPTEDQILQLSIFSVVAKDTRMSLQGLRTVLEIRRRIPVAFDTYTTVLKAVKYWAMRRKVYGNNFAFPAGVSLAILVARVCQVYPAHHPSVLLRFFFMFYTQWLARQGSVKPLFITEQMKPDNAPKIAGLWESWDPTREQNHDDLLPVLNPAYPSNNTCYNVGRTGLSHFYREITRAHLQLQGASVLSDWGALWDEYVIGDDYSTFLFIEVPAMPVPDQQDGVTVTSCKSLWDSWVLYIESKVKLLLFSLEVRFVDVRMWPRRLTKAPKCPGGVAWAVALKPKLRDTASASTAFSYVASEGEDVFGEEALQQLDAAAAEFKFAVCEFGRFPRNEQIMKDPLLRLVRVQDPNLPPELAPSRKRQRDA